MLRIHFILIRIRGSTSGKIRSGSDSGQMKWIWVVLDSIFFCIRYNTRLFFCHLWPCFSWVLNKKSFFLKIWYSYSFGWFLCYNEFCIRIRPKEVKTGGSGSAALIKRAVLINNYITLLRLLREATISRRPLGGSPEPTSQGTMARKRNWYYVHMKFFECQLT